MKINELLKEEWIGKQVIVDSKNKYLAGIKGKIIDETKNMFTIQTDKGDKRIMKSNNVFQTIYNGKTVNVRGNALLASPEDRIKIKV